MTSDQTNFSLSESKFLKLIVQHEAALRAYARCIVPDWDLVDEAIQEATVTMWQKREQLSSADGFVPWAKVFVRFKCLQQLEKLRSSRAVLGTEILETIASRSDAESSSRVSLSAKALHACLRNFAPEHRELLLAPHSSTNKIVDLAKRQNKSANSLYKLLGRLRERLSTCIKTKLSLGDHFETA